MYLAASLGFEILPLLEKIWLGFQVVFGIGLMIFIHELGHFAAAKKIGVRVEAFSLGFGFKLLSFKRGDTEYRLSAIPLGGYVKLAGENPDDPRTDAPDELQNRKVSERMIIFSAGVIMNLLFAFITIPIIFAVGIPFVKPEVGMVEPGGPAWNAGLQPGDRILEVNGNTIYEFNDIPLNIALGRKEGDRLLIKRDDRVFTVEVMPEMNEDEGRYQIRITSPTRYVVAVERGSPADRAGLKKGDRIVSVNGMTPKEWLEQGGSAGAAPLALRVARDDAKETLDLTVKPEEVVSEDRFLIGIQQRVNLVKGIRGALRDRPKGLEPGDFILKADGRPILTRRDWEEALSGFSGAGLFQIQIERNGERTTVSYEPRWIESLKNDLALFPNRKTNSIVISKGGAVDALHDPDLQDGARILSVNGSSTKDFTEISDAVQQVADGNFELTFEPADGKESKVVRLKGQPLKEPWIGFDFLPDLQDRKLNLGQAIQAGFNCSLYMIKTCYLTLSRILTGDVGGKNLGGIITISRASYTFAELGFARLFFFLAILSINLAFLNILPIPVLDGGHLLFLLIEKIKGSPVNEKIMGYSQIVGLVFILALLIYVTYNDILRLIY